MTNFEKEAQKLINQNLSKEAPSYQESIELGYYGFLHYFLRWSINEETMTTSADFDVVMKLAHIDQPRDYEK